MSCSSSAVRRSCDEGNGGMQQLAHTRAFRQKLTFIYRFKTKVKITMGRRERKEFGANITVAMFQELVDAGDEENDTDSKIHGWWERGQDFMGHRKMYMEVNKEIGSSCDTIQHEDGSGGHHQSIVMNEM